MGTGTVLYKIILLLHIAAAIVGLGGLIASSFYNAKAYRSTAQEAKTLLGATQSMKIPEYAVYGLLALGIVLVSISDRAIGYGEAWISASFVVWVLLVGCYHGLIRPTLKAMAETVETLTGGETLANIEAGQQLAKKLAMGEAGVQLLLAIALVLMIWKPGA